MIQRKNEGSQRCDLCSALGTGMSAVACTHRYLAFGASFDYR